MTTEAEDVRDTESRQPSVKPNIEAIAELIQNDGTLHSGEAKAQKAAADNAKIYTRIEKDLHGNKDAVKAIRRLIKAGRAMSDDFMRTFEPLAEHFELFPPADLVDQAQGKGEVLLSGGDHGRPVAVIEERIGDGGDGTDDGTDDDEDDDDDGTTDAADGGAVAPPPPADPDPAPVADNVTPFRSALDAAKGHLRDEPAPKVTPPRKPRGGAKPGAVVH